jgi:hypothetical protein
MVVAVPPEGATADRKDDDDEDGNDTFHGCLTGASKADILDDSL